MEQSAERRLPPQRIVLTGFMGSGKTTVGRLLAERLGWRFEDLDDAVSRRLEMTVAQIFAQYGEAAFRSAERDALAVLLEEERAVIALGGGAAETPAVHDLLAHDRDTAVIHLDVPFAVVFERCRAEAADPLAAERPLFQDRDAVALRYARRDALYRALAHYSPRSATETPAEVANEVLRLLGMQNAVG